MTTSDQMTFWGWMLLKLSLLAAPFVFKRKRYLVLYPFVVLIEAGFEIYIEAEFNLYRLKIYNGYWFVWQAYLSVPFTLGLLIAKIIQSRLKKL